MATTSLSQANISRKAHNKPKTKDNSIIYLTTLLCEYLDRLEEKISIHNDEILKNRVSLYADFKKICEIKNKLTSMILESKYEKF